MARNEKVQAVTADIILEYAVMLFKDVLDKGEVLSFTDVHAVIAPEVQWRIRRLTGNKTWTLRPDYMLNTLRLHATTPELCLAFCGNTVWSMDKPPRITTRLKRPKRSAKKAAKRR